MSLLFTIIITGWIHCSPLGHLERKRGDRNFSTGGWCNYRGSGHFGKEFDDDNDSGGGGMIIICS